jgi:hypothetical protein
MYAGTYSGGMRPYSLGESPLDTYESAYGYGPYLGENFFDKLQNIAQKVGAIAGEISSVREGNTKIATVPANSPTLVLPGGEGSPFGLSIPWWAIAAGGVGLFMLARGTKRRR